MLLYNICLIYYIQVQLNVLQYFLCIGLLFYNLSECKKYTPIIVHQDTIFLVYTILVKIYCTSTVLELKRILLNIVEKLTSAMQH